ncbi:MAG: hypothetical protein IPJ88_14345 [Myxococcales bacterium]|nr:MAG: hypothetical protein IPJ88_14345 [Myxococcales bacterium]
MFVEFDRLTKLSADEITGQLWGLSSTKAYIEQLHEQITTQEFVLRGLHIVQSQDNQTKDPIHFIAHSGELFDFGELGEVTAAVSSQLGVALGGRSNNLEAILSPSTDAGQRKVFIAFAAASATELAQIGQTAIAIPTLATSAIVLTPTILNFERSGFIKTDNLTLAHVKQYVRTPHVCLSYCVNESGELRGYTGGQPWVPTPTAAYGVGVGLTKPQADALSKINLAWALARTPGVFAAAANALKTTTEEMIKRVLFEGLVDTNVSWPTISQNIASQINGPYATSCPVVKTMCGTN